LCGRANQGLAPPEAVLTQVRSKLNAACLRGGKSWQDIFRLCDKNRDGVLDAKEVQFFVRVSLRVPFTTVSDYDLALLLQHLDRDESSTVDITELIEYVQKGSVRPQDRELRRAKRRLRVKRNLRMAFQDLAANEYEVRKLFQARDLDHSGKLSRYELSSLVREELGLTPWDVGEADLNELYNELDPNQDGIDCDEFWSHIKQANKEKHKYGVSDSLLSGSGQTNSHSARRFKTYRQDLLENMPRCKRNASLPALSSSFCEQGRDRAPRNRFAASGLRAL
jgi:Ca2+-binding EF-hand superfamily protein